MKYKTLHFGLFLLGGLSVCIPFVGAAELESHLPGDALAYVRWSGRSLTFDGSKFGQMILDPEVKKLVSFFQNVIEENTPATNFEHIWACVHIAAQHPVAGALYNINPGNPSGVLLVDLGEDKAAFEKEFQAIVDEYPLPKGRVRPSVQVGSYRYSPLPGYPMFESAFGYIDNIFFMTVGPDQARVLLECKPDASLQVNKKFQECMKTVGGENVQISVYLDAEAVFTQVDALLSQSASDTAPEEPASQPAVSPFRRVTKALGVDKVQAIAGTVCVVDKGMYTKLRIFTPAPHQGLLLPLAGATLTDADLAGVPGDVDMAIAANMSPRAVYDEFRRALKEYDPAMDIKAQGLIASLESRWNCSLEKDLLANLGDTWVYSVSPSQGGPIVGSMISVDVTDSEKLQAFINNLEKMILPPAPETQDATSRYHRAQPRIEVMKVGDTDIHYLRLPKKGIGMLFLPAWAVHENRLYVALWPQVIASALENTTEPLTKNAEYQALRKRFSPNASVLVYVNTPEIMKKLYPLQVVGGTLLMNYIADKTHTSQPIPLWPGSLNSVLQFLIPQMNVISHDAQGITLEGYGTCPSLLPATPLIASVALPSMHRIRGMIKQPVSGTYLRELGAAVMAYRKEKNEYPQKLVMLLEEGYATPKMFITRDSRKFPPRVEHGEFIDPTDYGYSCPASDASDATLMLYVDPANYRYQGTYVLYVGGHVEWVTVQRLAEMTKGAQADQADEK